MGLVYLHDLDDSRLDPYRALKATSAVARAGLFVAEGEKLARRLLASQFEVVSLVVAEELASTFAEAAEGVPLFVLPHDVIERLVGFNFHRGVLACGRRSAPLKLDDLCRPLSERATLVVCPDVQDPENLGSIFRLSDAFGAAGIVLGPSTADPLSRRVLRVSMGSSLRLPTLHAANVPEVLAELRRAHGFETWATVLADDAEPLASVPYPPRVALVFGSEGHGLSEPVIAACDRRVTLPLASGVDSLNVAQAAGIFLYQGAGVRDQGSAEQARSASQGE